MPTGCTSATIIPSVMARGPFHVLSVTWNIAVSCGDNNPYFCWILLGTGLTTLQFCQGEDDRTISEWMIGGTANGLAADHYFPFHDHVGGVYVGSNQILQLLPYFSANVTMLGDVLIRVAQ